MDELEIDGKTYLSSKAAAKLTGYAKDYVGQLCREGRVNARLVGRSWYVLEESIRTHRFGEEAEVDPSSIKKDESFEQKEQTEEESHPEVKEVTEKSSTYNADFEHVYFPDDAQPIEEAPMLAQEHVESGEEVQETEHISAMQDVWKEWFDHKGKQKEETLHSSELIEEAVEQDDKNTSYLLDSSEEKDIEEVVPVHIVHKEKERVIAEVDYMPEVHMRENREDSVPLSYTPVDTVKDQVVTRNTAPRSQRTFLGLKAALVGVVFVVASITFIALGFFGPAGTTNNPIYLYLSGETKI